ncbi:MipA/OmpV family protein [Paraburkholderia sp. BL25I1N1]|uniref:MipA/OmpV family protein n=1 Tax=Paraburkholderia sp. BL25I1N1 TaxID=1938804 RepID=UPI000D3FB3BD|nr:MipA/OmpV family protein [Paraburkholderia sp. BL25I1N1]PRY04541.1 outer membrane protein [Paraburkholderia sp. BL25I1N1]
MTISLKSQYHGSRLVPLKRAGRLSAAPDASHRNAMGAPNHCDGPSHPEPGQSWLRTLNPRSSRRRSDATGFAPVVRSWLRSQTLLVTGARHTVPATAEQRIPSRACRALLFVTSLLVIPGAAFADDGAGDNNSGFTVLSNATNVTHWGLGAGAEVQTMPYKGYRAQVTPLPFFYFDNKWVRAIGTTVDLKVGQWDGVSVALRGRVGILEGYRQSDAPILNGMQNRDSATFWYGPALAWESALGTLSSSYLFSGNKGHQASLDFRKEFQAGKWTLEPHITAEWLSSEYVNYYYGVSPTEVRIGRPAYQGSATSKISVGTRFAYQIADSQMVSLDVGVSHLGSGITDSPLVGKRFVVDANLVYLYQFR